MNDAICSTTCLTNGRDLRRAVDGPKQRGGGIAAKTLLIATDKRIAKAG
jgi:hypothetical protein